MRNPWPILLLALIAPAGATSEHVEIWPSSIEPVVLLSDQPLKVGQPFPHFRAQGIARELVDTSRFDVPFVVAFTQPWCGPCKIEAPLLERIATEYEGQIEVIAVAAEQQSIRPDLVLWVDQNDLTHPLVHDFHKRLLGKLAKVEMPTLIYVDDDGIVVSIETGFDGRFNTPFWQDFPLPTE